MKSIILLHNRYNVFVLSYSVKGNKCNMIYIENKSSRELRSYEARNGGMKSARAKGKDHKEKKEKNIRNNILENDVYLG